MLMLEHVLYRDNCANNIHIAYIMFIWWTHDISWNNCTTDEASERVNKNIVGGVLMSVLWERGLGKNDQNTADGCWNIWFRT